MVFAWITNLYNNANAYLWANILTPARIAWIQARWQWIRAQMQTFNGPFSVVFWVFITMPLRFVFFFVYLAFAIHLVQVSVFVLPPVLMMLLFLGGIVFPFSFAVDAVCGYWAEWLPCFINCVLPSPPPNNHENNSDHDPAEDPPEDPAGGDAGDAPGDTGDDSAGGGVAVSGD